MEFRILGPVEAGESGRPVALGGPKQCAVLALLLLRQGEVVSLDALIDALWGEDPPPTARKTVQVYVSNLRRALGDGRLETRGQGYAVRAEPEDVDLVRFERLAAAGRKALAAGDPEAAARHLGAALKLWRGPALAGAGPAEGLAPEVDRLEELRLVALEDRLEADLERGVAGELVAELERLVREHPLRERLRGQLMLALYRAGRHADALAGYRNGRRELIDQLGLEPGPRLQELERAILVHDPALDPRPPAPSGAVASSSGPGERRRLRRRRRNLATVAALLVCAGVAAVLAIALGGGGGAALVAPNSVAAIDPRTNRVVAQVRTGDTPTAVGVGVGGVWVLNANEQTIARVDPGTGAVVRRIVTGGTPTDLAVGPAALWVVERPDTLVRVDPGPTPIQRRLKIPLRRRPPPFSIPPAAWVATQGDSVWVSAFGTLARIDARTTGVARVRRTTFGQGPVAVGEGSVWVGGLARLNRSTGQLEASLSLPFEPSDVAVGDGAIWLTNLDSDTLWRIDSRTDTTERTISVGDHPNGVAVGAGAVWVASQDGTVARVDPVSNRVVRTIRVGGTPRGIAVGAGRVWVTVD